MKVFMTPKLNGTLVPSSESDMIAFKKLQADEPIELEIKNNTMCEYEYRFSCLLHALMGVDEIEREYLDTATLKVSLLMAAKHFILIPNFVKAGHETYVPETIYFNQMDEDDWLEFSANINKVVMARLKITEEDIDVMVNEVTE